MRFSPRDNRMDDDLDAHSRTAHLCVSTVTNMLAVATRAPTLATTAGSRAAVAGARNARAVSAQPAMAGRARTATRTGTPSSHGRRLAVRVRASDESDTATEAAPKVMDAPPKSKPGVGKPPINPLFLAAGDFAAAVLITLVARGVAGEDVISAGTVAAIPPFVVGWVGAGYLAGDYDADSPNAALWGDAPRAMTTGALTWFSGSAFAILLRNAEGSMMLQAPVINEQVEFAGALGLICAFRAAVAIAKPGAEEL